MKETVPATNGTGGPSPVVSLLVRRDNAGFGMKITGDKPVYVETVKAGGAAARAGLSAGDKIVKVNGVDVSQSRHGEVVDLIKSSPQAVITIQH